MAKEKANSALLRNYMWDNDYERQEWQHVIDNCDERTVNFMNNLLSGRAEAKVRLRHFIDPNFYHGAPDCFTWPYNENPDVNEYKATLQRNIIALKAAIKEIEGNKKRKSASFVKVDEVNKKAKPSPPDPKPKKKSVTTIEKISPIKSKPSTSKAIVIAQSKLNKSPSKAKSGKEKVNLKLNPQKVSLNIPRVSVPELGAPSSSKPQNPEQSSTLKPAFNLPLITTQPDSQQSEPEPEQQVGDETGLDLTVDSPVNYPESEEEEEPDNQKPTAPTTSTPKTKSTALKVNKEPPVKTESPTLKLSPRLILSDIVFADRILERMTRNDIESLGSKDITKETVQTSYAALKAASIGNEPRMASTYRRRMFNIKRYLKNKGIADHDSKYLDYLNTFGIRRYRMCASMPCIYLTLGKKQMDKHIRENHSAGKKEGKSRSVLLYKEEADDFRRILDHQAKQRK